MNKVVIIHHEPLTYKIKKNFFIENLQKKGVELLYWDISPILFGNLNLIDQIEESYVVKFYDIRNIEEEIKKNLTAIFILEYAHDIKTLKIDAIFKRLNCTTAAIGIHTAINLSLREKLCNIRDYGFQPFVLCQKIWNKFLYTIRGMIYPAKKVPDIFFYCGSASKLQYPKVHNSIPINSFDFEDYICQKECECTLEYPENSFIVFIDQFYPYHPDMIAYNASAIDPDKYYKNLNIYFDKIEKQYQRPVIVLAHPKADYTNSIFNGRHIVKYRTPEFVKNAYMILCHDSMAISFAVLNYKPIIFLYTKAFYHMGITTMILIKKFSKMLGCPMVCIDNISDKSIFTISPTVDKFKYNNYKYAFLTSSDAEQCKNEDIISNYIVNFRNINCETE